VTDADELLNWQTHTRARARTRVYGVEFNYKQGQLHFPRTSYAVVDSPRANFAPHTRHTVPVNSHKCCQRSCNEYIVAAAASVPQLEQLVRTVLHARGLVVYRNVLKLVGMAA